MVSCLTQESKVEITTPPNVFFSMIPAIEGLSSVAISVFVCVRYKINNR